MRKELWILALAATTVSFSQDLRQAERLYERTDYDRALGLLQSSPGTSAEYWALVGKCNLMRGNFKRATECLQKAVALEPKNSDYMLWLGRTWGRRAEIASPFIAPLNASKARDCFEKALQLNPANRDALGDLFDYYLHAPGFLGGGTDKAEAIAKRIEAIDPPEGHFALSQLAQKQHSITGAEQELRAAVKLAPNQIGHVIALARFLARQARFKESDAVFQEAETIAPDSPRIMYARASTYIETHRNLDEARSLLKKYLQATLTPDDTPREVAEKLLQSAGSE